MHWLETFTSPSGRIGRVDFVTGVVMLIGVEVVVGLVGHFPWLVGFGLSLFFALTGLCLFVQRLHDLGRTGYLVLAPVALAAILAAAVAVIAPRYGAVTLAWGSRLIWLPLIFWLALVRGQKGNNRFGRPPTHTLFGALPKPEEATADTFS
jgi:uncharacterized membrane protein YhaH (DUF805 family)